jgi:hypothetical protein
MPNGGVDRAARFHATFAAPFKLQNTVPPLRSNDLLGRAAVSKPAYQEVAEHRVNKNPQKETYRENQ